MFNDNKNNYTDDYDASKITVLEGLEAVRKRPGMYIGGTGQEGLYQLFKEILDNAIDEALAGYASLIKVTINKDGSISVEDNGRGIPVDIHPKTQKTALETVLTMLHAGGKFGEGGYKVSGGLHGVGLTVTNALSEWMEVEVYKNGKTYSIGLNRGQVVKPFREISQISKRGTKVTFLPDKEIFESVSWDYKKIINIVRQKAFLVGGLKFIIKDERQPDPYDYVILFEGGILSYVINLVRGKEIIGDFFYVKKNIEDTEIEISFTYTDSPDYEVMAFANLVYNPEGGTHVSGFKASLTKTLNDYARKYQLIKEKEEGFLGEDVLEGIRAVISVKLKNPQFEGQTKIKLNNTEVLGYVKTVLNESLYAWLEENPKVARAIIDRCILSLNARKAAKAARESVIRKSILEGAGLPGKLADCTSKDPTISELFIVEGMSAGGSAKQGRDRMTQAVLPLRGKPINTEKHRIDKVLANEILKQLVLALGCGIGNMFDRSKLRYHKIIILSDADVDGAHIQTLLLTFFYRQLKPLVSLGHIFIAQPPLYRITVGKTEYYWVRDDQAKNELLERLSRLNKKVTAIQRFKGLGEMNPDQLWETTMNPQTRILKQITIDDAQKADEIFEMLMGNDVAPRKKFIQMHAKLAQLDV